MPKPVLRDQMVVWDDVPGPGLVCPASEDRARQEFKEEADLEFQIRRFGAGLPFEANSVDYTMDLTKAYDLVERAQAAWSELPRPVREQYANWREVEAAAVSGQLESFLKGLADPGAPPAPNGAGAAPGSATPSTPSGGAA